MTPIELLLLTFWVGFGIRAGWFACDLVLEAVPAAVDALERWRYRRELAKPDTVTIVNNEFHGVSAEDQKVIDRIEATIPLASGGFVRPRSHG